MENTDFNMTIEKFYIYISMVLVVAGIGYGLYLIYKYRPLSVIVKMMYDFRYFIIQVVLMYSSKPSIFSLKRFNSGLILYWSITTASLFIRKKTDLSPEGLMLIIVPILGLGGYNLYQIQKEKTNIVNETLNNKIVDNATDVANKIVDNESKES